MLSPETIQLMAQTYEEWMQDPSALSRPLETMQWAYQPICAGADPWTGLGSFSHAWYGYAKARRTAFVRRNIFCTNRPFQNKYEMYKWTQEARAKGITQTFGDKTSREQTSERSWLSF
jgi:hypothetical protein